MRHGAAWEKVIDGAAAGVLAASVGLSLARVGAIPWGAAGAGILAGGAALALLRRIGAGTQAYGFALADLAFDDSVSDELLLDDRLDAPEPHSAVVRLFAVGGSSAPHLPGELADRIERFLDTDRPVLQAVPAVPDAAQELYEALADIRRTLRSAPAR